MQNVFEVGVDSNSKQVHSVPNPLVRDLIFFKGEIIWLTQINVAVLTMSLLQH